MAKTYANFPVARLSFVLSIGPAAIITSAAYMRNHDLEAIMMLMLALLTACLAGLFISYLAYDKLRDYLAFKEVSAQTTAFFFTVYLLLVGKVIISALISFEVAYGYFLLPLLVCLAGVILFRLTLMIIGSSMSDAAKLAILVITALILAIPALLVP